MDAVRWLPEVLADVSALSPDETEERIRPQYDRAEEGRQRKGEQDDDREDPATPAGRVHQCPGNPPLARCITTNDRARTMTATPAT
jgi:hypothetical protein